jgi:hypothetical protein
LRKVPCATVATQRFRPWATDQSADDLQRSAEEPAPLEEAVGPAPVQVPDRAGLEGQAATAPPRGRGLELSSAAMLLGMQQRAGNQAVQRYLQRATLQREEAGATAQVTPADPATAGGASGGAGAAGGATKGKTANITLTALYESVPGTAKDKVRRADSDDALWFDPLHVKSSQPQERDKKQARGITAGGETTIDTFAAPVTEKTPSVGRGSITAQLKYAGQRNKSFNVTVGGVTGREKGPAEAAAREKIQAKMDRFGDVEDITRETEAELKEKYPNATVSLSVKRDQVVDAGKSTFYYKVRNDAGILMEVQVVPIGEKQTRYSGSKTTSKGSEDESTKKDRTETEKVDIKKDVKESERKTGKSTESVEVAYNEAVVRTLDDYVSKSGSVHKEVSSVLAETVVNDSDFNSKEKWVSKRVAKDVTDYTKKVEKGERDKENFANKVKKVIGGVRQVTRIPFLDRLPGGKWIQRRVKGWQLDIAEWIADQFAESGKVQYEDTEAKSDRDIKDDTTITKDLEAKRVDKTTKKRELEEDYQTTTKEDWERHLKDVTTVAKEYKSRTTRETDEKTDKTRTEDYSKTGKREESEAGERHKATENQSTTTNFEVSTTWKFTAPVVKATVVSGDAEVSNAAFPAEPGETVEKAPPPSP